MKLSIRPGCRGPFFVQFGSVEGLIGSIWALNIKKSDFYKKSKMFVSMLYQNCIKYKEKYDKPLSRKDAQAAIH